MREPELVFKAQLAAAALERAWERWRSVHGVTADPLPPISSYVGYSLEEPWGQPRVVFGLAAEDAEQLVALLDRHDCVGPVYKTIAAGQGARELPSEASGQADRPVSVPRQAPSLASDSLTAVSQAAEPGRGDRFANSADYGAEQDGPVFRELMAAAGRTSGTPMAAHVGAAPDAGDAASAVGVLDADAEVGGQDTVHIGGEMPSPSPDGAAADAEPAAPAEEAADAAPTAETPQETEIPPEGEAVPVADMTKDAGIVLGAAQADVDSAPLDDSPDDPPEEPADGPGPLAQAASTARVEAEARIRAAMGQATVAERSASEEPAAAAPQHANPGDSTTIESAANEDATNEGTTLDGATDETAPDKTKPATTPAAAPPRTTAPAGKQGSAKKPPAGAAAEAPPVARPDSADEPADARVEAADRDHPHDIASSLGRPESEVNDVNGPTIGAFGFGSDLVGSVGSYNEPGKRSDQSQDHASPGYGRRGRSTRSYSIPRLSKSKRAGVSPGA